MLRDLRHRLEYAAFASIHGLIRRMPHSFAGQLGRALGRSALSFGKRRRLMLGNLRHAFPEKTEAELRSIANRCAGNIGASFFEEASATRFSAEEFSQRFEVDGWEHIEALQKAGQSYLMITAHFGPFDFVVYPLAQRLGPISIVVQVQTNPYTRARMDPMREHIGAILIHRHRAGARILTLLRRGENVGLAVDQRVRPWDGILIPFLGRQCWTSPVPALVCLRTKCPTVPVFCQPAGPGRYRLLIREPIWPRDLGPDPIHQLTYQHHQAVEREARRAPERWFWIHDRWRLIWQHSNEKSLARMRRESGLPESQAALSPSEAHCAQNIDEWLNGERLEATANLRLEGDAPRAAIAAEAGRRVLERGYAVRYLESESLAEKLENADERNQLQIELRTLDPFPLVIVDGSTQEPRVRDRVLQVIEHRRGRGSVLLSAPRDELLDRALNAERTLEASRPVAG